METRADTAAAPERLAARLPADPPAGWQRTDGSGGIVEYRLPGEDGVCAAAKVTVRPDVLGEAAVRVDRTEGCRSAGTARYDDVEAAVDAVRTELQAAEL